MIRRFLRARDLDIEKASTLFLKCLSWKRAFVPDGFISESEVTTQLSHKKLCMQGHDKNGRPIVVGFGGRHKPNEGSIEEFKRMLYLPKLNFRWNWKKSPFFFFFFKIILYDCTIERNNFIKGIYMSSLCSFYVFVLQVLLSTVWKEYVPSNSFSSWYWFLQLNYFSWLLNSSSGWIKLICFIPCSECHRGRKSLWPLGILMDGDMPAVTLGDTWLAYQSCRFDQSFTLHYSIRISNSLPCCNLLQDVHWKCI